MALSVQQAAGPEVVEDDEHSEQASQSLDT
jgi:hypothetical protein